MAMTVRVHDTHTRDRPHHGLHMLDTNACRLDSSAGEAVTENWLIAYVLPPPRTMYYVGCLPPADLKSRVRDARWRNRPDDLT